MQPSFSHCSVGGLSLLGESMVRFSSYRSSDSLNQARLILVFRSPDTQTAGHALLWIQGSFSKIQYFTLVRSRCLPAKVPPLCSVAAEEDECSSLHAFIPPPS
ncbi:hypothetical protein XENOCAPTIV_018600 [Xenoophorus captivus]|uniref:Uncharacterized protein n=1 Tax=Xenoophorus captivus TaxID=1517983 RepID=A0ABV0R113_9TELE